MSEYTVIIEQDEEGYYVAEAPELKGCYTQAKSLDELMVRIREVIALCADEEPEERPKLRFIEVQRISV
jgi:predicted RNase H-like HicB family nuclease